MIGFLILSYLTRLTKQFLEVKDNEALEKLSKVDIAK